MKKNNKIIAKREVSERKSLLKQEISIMSWPLPSPKYLEKYEKILPWLARELVDMAKKEQGFRHNEISRVNKYRVNSGYLWVIISLFIFLFIMSFFWFLIYLEKSIKIVVSMSITVLTFAWIFMRWKNWKK